MAVFVEVICNWVTQSVDVNEHLMAVDLELELCTCFTCMIALFISTFFAFCQVHYLRRVVENLACFVKLFKLRHH